MISSLNNVLNLQGISNLENLIFSEKDGSNPICSYDTYISFIADNINQVKILDNKDIGSYLNDFYKNGKNINPNENSFIHSNYNNFPSKNQTNPWINTGNNKTKLNGTSNKFNYNNNQSIFNLI